MQTPPHIIYPGSSVVRRMVDPYQKLPHVELHGQGCNEYLPSADDYRIVEAGSKIGKVTIANTLPDEVSIENIRIGDESIDGVPLRGRGLGLATYVCAIEFAHQQGKTFITDLITKTGTVKIWHLFRSLEIAEEVEPFEQLGPGYPDHYTGIYRIPPLD